MLNRYIISHYVKYRKYKKMFASSTFLCYNKTKNEEKYYA